MALPRLVIVTGLSGAGKTQALRSLEDIGFFCVDNLPPALIPKFTELCAQAASRINKIAMVVDIRGGEFFSTLSLVLADLDAQGVRYEILFLEASDEVLVRRFKETRRRHPLSEHGEVLDVIRQERRLLRDLRGRADRIIDTSHKSVRELKEEIAATYADTGGPFPMHITIMSFGYKYGIPLDSDLVMDVRFLPNPYYHPALKNLTGNDRQVREYVFSSEVTGQFMDKFSGLVEFLIPHYISEGKATLLIAIGCTGGRHRSVVLANYLGEVLSAKNYRVAVRHRDLDRTQ